VEPGIAHRIASRHHVGQRNRFGDPVIDHVERVAAAVPTAARARSWLHDLLEHCPPRAGSSMAWADYDVLLELHAKKLAATYDIAVVNK